MNTTVSIAMATYNGAKFLRPLLDSLMNQTMTPTEIIVCDDQSKDETVAILEEYKGKLPIKVFINEKNLGVNLNFEKAVKNCTSDYILICDQDDIWLENNIEEKVRALIKLGNKKPAFVGSYSTIVNAKNDIVMKFPVYKYTENFRDVFLCLYQGTCMGFSKTLIPYLNEWPSNFKEYAYDRYIGYVSVLVANVCNLPKNLMLYRCHSDNVELTSASKSHIQLRRIGFVSNLIYFSQRRPTVKKMEKMALLLKSDCCAAADKSRLNFFNAFASCLKEGKISWFKYIKQNEIALFYRIKTLFAFLLSNVVK